MDKTNEQKAVELSTKHTRIAVDGVLTPLAEMIDACVEMAEWKEKQMIEKAYNWIADNVVDYLDRSDYMAEDFKKAMKEN